MTRILATLAGIGVVMFTVLSDAAVAHGYKKRAMEVVHPWTYEQDGVVRPTAIVAMKLRNTGKTVERLVAVETKDAVSSELIAQPGTDPGRGRPSIEIKPGETIQLSAIGPHIKLKGIKPTLFAYNSLVVTLVFERAGRVTVDVLVVERPEEEGD